MSACARVVGRKEGIRVQSVNSPDVLEESIRSAMDSRRSPSEPVFLLITSTNDANTGRPWCPDCEAAEPVIEHFLNGLDQATLLEAQLSRETYKGNPNHPYRKHQRLQLRAVPTLYLWSDKGPLKSLVEERCLSEQLLQALLE